MITKRDFILRDRYFCEKYSSSHTNDIQVAVTNTNVDMIALSVAAVFIGMVFRL